MSASDGANNNLDIIFAEVGEFGVFQVVPLILICIPSLVSASYVVNYIFTTNKLVYRSEKYTKMAIRMFFVHKISKKRKKLKY